MGPIRKSKNKRRTRDLDLIHGDLRHPTQLKQHIALVPEEDRPGLGRFHCIECAKFFESQANLEAHFSGKRHKRRMRMLKEDPYTIEEANAAVGQGVKSFIESRRKAKEAEELGQKPMEIDAEM
ncbi:hypothetical protein DFH27DRAFT_614183 [Peziza echinospora]|nr:hypothetical protein DFH27DRAFT_614183 [Peziza echinospora]